MKTLFFRRFLAVCAVAALAISTLAPTNVLRAEEVPGLPEVADAPQFDAAALAKIPVAMQAEVDAHGASGIVTLVAHEGRIVHLSAVGKSSLETGREMTTDTLFGIASMTKPITATALMILVDQKKVSLDDEVAKYLPSFKNVKLKNGEAPKTPITLRHLLTHTSGMGGSQANEGTLAETVEKFAERPLDFQPGEKWQYSPAISVIGRVVEVVSGEAYDVFLKKHIFDPLGMVDTTFVPTKQQQERLVQLYKPGADKKSLVPSKSWITDLSGERTPNPSGGLFSTARDLARFYQMALNGGEYQGKRIVSQASITEMTKLQTGDIVTGFTPGCGWGLGYILVREPQGVTAMLSPGTFGHGGAFGTQGWVDPGKKMFFVLLIQREGFGNADGSELRGKFQQLTIDAMKK